MKKYHFRFMRESMLVLFNSILIEKQKEEKPLTRCLTKKVKLKNH